MKVFTVLTAVFLPLTLIVGWFGMNVKMPEYSWTYGYPYVIVLSIVVCGICGWIFKKKKWF
jgi:magnesium transporter